MDGDAPVEDFGGTFGGVKLSVGGFAAVPSQPVRANGPGFQPVAFALDVILPILDRGQEKAFTPSDNTAWVAWASAIAGCLLATTVIAGLTRRLSRSGH
ncbi:hypothetical protein [Streptomyces sp. NPDC059863]|uniref:hypothetical protein n=1 Tax=unclassified Streptomyces TaxID=2593676 RepID=UPI003668F2FA